MQQTHGEKHHGGTGTIPNGRSHEKAGQHNPKDSGGLSLGQVGDSPGKGEYTSHHKEIGRLVSVGKLSDLLQKPRQIGFQRCAMNNRNHRRQSHGH